MKVLLVWEEIPESTKFYLLDGEQAEAAYAAHGCFVNLVDGDPNGAADRLNCILTDMEPLDASRPFKFEESPIVVHSGFML